MAEKDEEGIPADEGRVEACSLRRELAVITYNFDKKDEVCRASPACRHLSVCIKRLAIRLAHKCVQDLRSSTKYIRVSWPFVEDRPTLRFERVFPTCLRRRRR